MIGYSGEAIQTKTIFEPSFGDGAFLTAIVKRITDYATSKDLPPNQLCTLLDNVYAVELDKKYYDITIQKLNAMLPSGVTYDWPHIVCENTLTYEPPVKFDLCVANPPYQKILHIDLSTRELIENNYQFGKGNTDLYVIFFEACFKMMKNDAKLCFITPNSFFKNSSQSDFRKYVVDNNLLRQIIDYGSVKVFKNAATYTAISMFDFNKDKQETQYVLMKSLEEESFKSTVLLNANGEAWNFSNPDDNKWLDANSKKKQKLSDFCDVQHGIATNLDKVYVVAPKQWNQFEPEILRPVTKGSKLDDSQKIIFPYVWNNETNRYDVIEENVLMEQYPQTYAYLLSHKDELLRRDLEKNATWYQYARGQGIQNTKNRKIVLKHVLPKDGTVCEIQELSELALVYSGIYIVVKDKDKYDQVKDILLSKDFHKYLWLTGKNMSGGYKSTSAKIIKNFGI